MALAGAGAGAGQGHEMPALDRHKAHGKCYVITLHRLAIRKPAQWPAYWLTRPEGQGDYYCRNYQACCLPYLIGQKFFVAFVHGIHPTSAMINIRLINVKLTQKPTNSRTKRGR